MLNIMRVVKFLIISFDFIITIILNKFKTVNLLFSHFRSVHKLIIRLIDIIFKVMNPSVEKNLKDFENLLEKCINFVN